MSSLALVRLLQLASPTLPVGAYSYSQGLENAIESGIVKDAVSAQAWIADVLELSVASLEGPVLLRLMRAWENADLAEARRWNGEFIASRETAELRAETLQMGFSLRSLVNGLGIDDSKALDALDPVAFPTVFAFAAAAWRLESGDALAAYLFAWVENQALAASKALPLGQTDTQRLMRDVAARIPALVERARGLGDDALANFAPGLALASSRHETQYTRLFRS
jgi:urease accessory protein